MDRVKRIKLFEDRGTNTDIVLNKIKPLRLNTI